MKKNFFKKLALVMALTVTVTSIPAHSASAAAKPGFKSTAVKVNVDQTKKYSTANSAKYSVSFKIGNKSVATISSSAGSKSVKVTGVAAGKTTLRADFKSYSTKKVTTAKVPVTVAEVATTLSSVEAKGAKTIVATFNKAVDTEKAVIAVKKGSATPSISTTKWADDKKSVTITTGAKLTEGTYTVSVTGLTEAELKGDITVKDETLTSIEIVGTNLVAKGAAGSTDAAIATIAFKTLNQYGERMPGATLQVTSSFGVAAVKTACTATQTGVVEVTGIVPTLQVVGTSGSITVVDTTKGVTATATVTYSAPATAKTMTIAGLYNITDAKFSDMTKGDTISDYVVLATIEDQYGNSLSSSQLGAVNANLIPGGGVTAAGTWTDRTIDGKDYVALSLVGGTASAGTFYFTFVNPSLGLLANTSFVVSAGTVIKTLSISANDSIYQGQDNTLALEAVDTDGNAVTKYSTLNGLLTFSTSDVKLVKQANGTAKLVYNPAVDLTGGNGKQTAIKSFTVTANAATPTNLIVKPLTFTTYQQRVAKEVTGLKTGTATAVASGEAFKLYATDLVIEDQYSNVMSDSEVKALTNIEVITTGGTATITVSGTAAGNTFPTAHYVTLTAGTTIGTTSLKLGIGNTTDYSVTLDTVDSSKATNLAIKSIKDGNVVKSSVANTLAATDVKVTGTVAGKTVIIPQSQYVVSGNTGYNLGTASATNPAQTLTGSLEVTVDTDKGSVVIAKDYSFSNANSTLTTIEAKESVSVAAAATLTKTQLETLFTLEDQYGDAYTGNAVKYEVVDVTSGTTVIKVAHNSTNDATVTGAVTGNKLAVTATYGTITATKTITLS